MSDLFARAYAHFGAGSGSRNIARGAAQPGRVACPRPHPRRADDSEVRVTTALPRQNQIQHSESLPSGTDNYTVEPAGPTV
jgi:hypothetical protein